MTGWGKIQALRKRHSKMEIAVFFGGGFLFDVVTMDRIDSRVSMGMHAVYLTVLGLLLHYELLLNAEVVRLPQWLFRVWMFREDVLHFLLGSLLSSFSLFYFKSAAGWHSLGFLAISFGLLVANELPVFRKSGNVVRVVLFAFCLTSFFSYVYPTFLGFLSPWLFLASVLTVLGVGAAMFVHVGWKRGEFGWAGKRFLVPWVGTVALLVGLYWMGAIPPLPLSVQKIGIYHEVERPEPGQYVLRRAPTTWRLWLFGKDEFLARPGDKIYVFARIFAPTHFKDRVNIHWQYEDAKQGWVEAGKFAFTLMGGREEGFRGYAYKENYQQGHWRVLVETDDGRVIGLIGFRVLPDTSLGARRFVSEPG